MKGFIYYFINKVTKERYVGKTMNLSKRKSVHLNQLKNNAHPNEKLQNAWNYYGEENFEFGYEEFDLNEEKDLSIIEKAFIQHYDSFCNGYNKSEGGEGGSCGPLTFEQFCFIYFGCKEAGYTEKIAKLMKIDSSTVSAIFNEKSYLTFLEEAKKLKEEDKNKYRKIFLEYFPEAEENKKERKIRHISEEEYFICLCITACYGRGIEAALAKFFNKHKSFISNGIKGKTKGKAFNALQKYLNSSQEEIEAVSDKFIEEWNIKELSTYKLEKKYNKDKWRN